MSRKLYGIMLLLFVIMLYLPGCEKKEAKGTETVDTQAEEEQTKEEDSAGEVQPDKEDAAGETEGQVKEGEAISFSLTDSFYPGDISLEILGGSQGNIYYTTDGTDPDEEKTLYEKPISLNAGEEIKVVSVKAKAFYEDGSQSPTIVHTYFIGDSIESRFDTLVFSVTTDPYNLYDNEYGILVEGKLREDYVKEHPWEKIDPPAPANYNLRGRESEREVYLEVFEPDGTKIASQNAGIRAYGGWSRASLQKSIKIYTRKDYDEENNKLRYEFFPSKLTYNGSPADAFNRLVLRNSGNDNGFGFIRDELFQTLAAQAGYADYEAVRPATLYIDGNYQGVYWLHEVYCDDYFDENYGNYDGSFSILEGGETYKNQDTEDDNTQQISDYEAMYAYSTKDLTDDATYKELCKLLDVENYLSYYALQVYIGNEDWPHNNYKTYRYYTTEGEEYREAPFDGKWRYMLHDLDFTFAIYGTGAYVDNIQKYLGSNGEIRQECPLFGQLMQREDCREIFIKKTMDLINGAFAPDNINRVLGEMNDSRLNEQKNMYHKNLLADWVEFEQLEGRMEEIRTYGYQRAEHIPEKYREFFKLGELYQVQVQPAQGCGVKINSYTTEDTFIGNYFTDYNTVITPILPEGKEFAYWQVNGTKYDQEELIVTPAMLKDQKAEVVCITK
jgi:hypothetical protein